ncbi:MAG: hypothetical protein HY735_02700 [Verrucomicrobia bacterium]|nr:hypothetical protein [Verrucomicrobiota bacterium]
MRTWLQPRAGFQPASEVALNSSKKDRQDACPAAENPLLKRSLNPLRHFLLVLLLTLSSSGFSLAAPALSEIEQSRLREALSPLHEQYDPAEQMLRRPFSSPGYHTTLKGGMVHPTRDSLTYAAALLDTGDAELLERAQAILKRVISLQDQDPQNRTYGIWPWFLEESLAQMSPPDWNWADFCGVQLLQAALDHRERLKPEILAMVDAAIRHAANSIRKRNVGPGYTNIAIMGVYVTLVAAELYQLPDLHQYALERLRRFYDYTREQGAFTEYNSPTYTLVALKELARLRQHAKSPEANPLVEELYQFAWKEIAAHFHPPARQWAGPHSRAYRSLMTAEHWAFLDRATDHRISFGSDKPSLDEARAPMPCPRELESFFSNLPAPREHVQTFLRGTPSIIGTTYLHPAFTLGSVNRGDFWNQRRAVLAYWGSAEKPAYLHLRCLHDGYDFAAAQLFSVQRQGRVLAGIAFAIDGGDRHVSLDRIKNGTIAARDLRFRFEFGGSAAERLLSTPKALKEPVQINFGPVQITLEVPVAFFGEEPVRWEAGRERGESWLDLVLLRGEDRLVDFTQLNAAAVAVALQITADDEAFPQVWSQRQADTLALKWAGLELSFPAKPAAAKSLRFRALRAEADSPQVGGTRTAEP